MINVGDVDAEIVCVEDKRIVIYDIRRTLKNSNPNLGDILFWLNMNCERLLKNLQRQNADTKDIEYLKNESDFLKQAETEWRVTHRRWWHESNFPDQQEFESSFGPLAIESSVRTRPCANSHLSFNRSGVSKSDSKRERSQLVGSICCINESKRRNQQYPHR
jgi:hypothetical protein